LKRTVDKEQFFTSQDYAERCVALLRKHFDLESFKSIVEPSAGTGIFIEALAPLEVEAIDIEPRHPLVSEADFLSWLPSPLSPRLVIGNPPFGQRGALAAKFLERACEMSDVVAFILPRSFRKYTFLNRVDSFFHLRDQIDGDRFTDSDGSPISVKTTFQIWERKSYRRDKIESADTHPHFRMRHAHLSRTTEVARARLVDEFAFAIPHVGATFKPRPASEINRGSWWFIAPVSDDGARRFERLDFSFCENMNTAHTSLSKQDIVRAYQKALDDETGGVLTSGE